MARLSRLTAALLLVALLAPVASSALAMPAASTSQQTAPCYLAAMAALTARGALYSQGGALADDPIDPATGQPYPRTGPDSFDCSGLVWWSYAQAGVEIGTTTYSQINNGVPINCTLANLNGADTTCWTLGDLIFLRYSTGQHVAIYVGSGLFMDCYNHVTGCILHDVSGDSFYGAHFYQARRIVSGCESLTNDPGTPTTIGGAGATPTLEEVSDLIGYVAFIVPQCNDCNGPENDTGLRPVEPPPNDGWLDTVLYPFRWLAVAIENLFINLICWLLSMLQIVANMAAGIANRFIYFVNQLWKFLIFSWLALRAWLYGSWAIVELLRDFFQQVEQFLLTLGAWLAVLLDLFLTALSLAGQLLLVLLQLGLTALNLLGWVGGLVLGLAASIVLQFQAPTIPSQLQDTHIVYLLTRGALEAMRDSAVGWLLRLCYAMAYVGFVVWLSRFLSGGKEA